ncbi:MAG: GIY-YIG nuclease family protein [Chloroflexi bacterium]|nr:GIY-YIG nuclease family protein [Chloroflexota bacterium]
MSEKGTYILHLQLDTPRELTIGKRGTFPLAAGWYAYVGSAFGLGGLRGRLGHHLSVVSRPHWHIDYLRQAAMVVEIWYVVSPVRYEHQWAAVLQHLSGASMPVPRFGASDCDCPSHLFYFEAAPSLMQVGQALGEVEVMKWPQG